MDQTSVLSRVLKAYCYTFLWIGLSGAVILTNKWILDPKLGGFPFPLTLGATHMAFCWVLSAMLIKSGLVEAQPMPAHVYTRGVLPIGGLFAVTLWASNAAYLHLSVSFIQMIKATMPLLVYLAGSVFGTERMERGALINMAVVVGGVLTATCGEAKFVLVGVLLQALSLCAESLRLVLVQVLLQGRGVKLNPITTMYHVAPVCLMCLVLPLSLVEAGAVYSAPSLPLGRLLGSAAAAFCLNCSVFLLIGKTSALTMNVAGVVKDWMLIAASVLMYKSIVTPLQVAGYSVAMAGVLWYNYSKVRSLQQAAAPAGGSGNGCSDAGDGKPAQQLRQPLLPPLSPGRQHQQQQQQLFQGQHNHNKNQQQQQQQL